MSDEPQYWEGYRLNPDGTIQFSAIVDYGLLLVPSGVILQFNHAPSQEAMDRGELESVQLHMAADQVRECATALLGMADQLEQGGG